MNLFRLVLWLDMCSVLKNVSCVIEKMYSAVYGLSILYIYLLGLMEKAMAPHSSTLAWRIPWTEEPGRLQSMASLRVRHD